MNDILINMLLGQGESETLEFKTGSDDVTSIAKVICSFANSKGGTIIIGVTDEGEVQGVDNAEERELILRKVVRKMISPQLYINTTVVEVPPARKVILMDVPSSQDKPYTCQNKIFVRQGARTIEAGNDWIRKLIIERVPQYARWERQLALGSSVTDLDGQQILLTGRMGNESNLIDFGPNFTVDSVLERLGLIDGDTICNGGLVLFGESPAKRMPQTRIRAVRYSGTEKDRIIDNRVFEGNIFDLLKKATSFLETHVPVQSEIPTVKLYRNEAPALPFMAVRETLINAVAHRDYAAPDGGIIISIYSDRVEIWNSGSLPVGISLSELKTISVSRPHNPDMAHVLLIRGYMERVGSGIQRILTAFKQEELPEPEWKEMGGGILVILRWQKSQKEFNERQMRLLRSLDAGQRISIATYRKHYAEDIQERQARLDLRELVNLGYLQVQGRGPATEYIRTELHLS